jgi:hypothetical protein
MLLSGWGLLVMAALIALGAVGIRAVQHQIAQRAAQSAELSARLVSSLTVRRNLKLDTFRGGGLFRVCCEAFG